MFGLSRGKIKMRRLVLLGLIVFVLSLAGSPMNPIAAGQEPPKQIGKKPANGDKQDPQEPGTISEQTTNVRLTVSVIDKNNRFVTDLKQPDFQIYEDGIIQRIESFRPEGDLPLDIAVLMDTSNSVKPKLKFEKDAAVSFLYTMLQSRRDRALFATFDSEIELHQDFTNRIDLLSQAIDKVKARGETRLYDAIYSVCEEKMFATTGRRRAMVIITDGEDTVSEHTLKDAIDIAQRSETTVFIISTKAGGFFGVEAGTVDR
ncbi:MAG: VWA domain-containing protein, partial [Acidobacteriota bacterium]